MQNLDCNQIKIFINLEIIGKEDKNKKTISIFFIKKSMKYLRRIRYIAII